MKMNNAEVNYLIATKIMGLVPQVDFGEWDEHIWRLDDKGEIDMYGMEFDGHSGPICDRCGYSYCKYCRLETDISSDHPPCIMKPSFSKKSLITKLNEKYIVVIEYRYDKIICELFDCFNTRLYCSESMDDMDGLCKVALKSVGVEL